MMQADSSHVSGVSGRYATALFALAQESGSTDAVAKELNAFEETVKNSPELKAVLSSAAVSTDAHVELVKAVLKKMQIKGLVSNFVQLVASKRRLGALMGMIASYRALHAQAQNIQSAEVVVAQEPSSSQLADIRKALEVRAGGKVDLKVTVNADIIGGLIVKMGSRMVDASLKTKLNSLRLAMQDS
jgi:F-type H+-transporting ATPase subunit delta